MKLNKIKKNNVSDKILMSGIFICILSTQGILLNYVLSKIGIGFLKSILFEVGVIISIIAIIYKEVIENRRIRATITELLVITYIILEIILLIIKDIDVSGIIYTIKETWLIFILIIIYNKFKDTLIENYKYIVKVLFLLNVLNLFAAIISFIIGAEKYMIALTGRYIYPMDPELKFKISHISGILRTPALIGESASFAYFSALSFIIFDLANYKKGKLIAITNLILTFTRSAYIFTLIYIALIYIKRFNTKKYTIGSITMKIILGITALITIAMFIIKGSEFISIISSSSSTSERFQVWNSITSSNLNENFLDVMIGGSLGELGNAYNGDGMLKVFDNAWMYLYYNIGLIGMILLILLLYTIIDVNYNKFSIMASLFASMIFINIFQSECVIALLPIATTLCYKCKDIKKNKMET